MSLTRLLSSKHEISEIFSNFSQDLNIIEDNIKTVISSDAEKLTEISSYLLNLGGKRIRPLMCLLSARMFGMARANQALVDVASGIEMIHMATLLHDDIIDKSPTRRGKPSAYLLFGSDPTLLAGDFLFVRAFGLCGMLDKYTIKATENACIAVIEGEELEGFINLEQDYPIERYLNVIGKKTSALFALSCKIGAHLAGVSPEIVSKLHAFGMAAGASFQIVDDILDVTSDEKTLGKKPGNDLRQGTPTLINLLWLKQDPKAAKEFFLDRSEKNVILAMSAIQKSSVLEQAQQMATGYYNQALNILDELEAANQTEKEMFIKILNFTLKRSH